MTNHTPPIFVSRKFSANWTYLILTAIALPIFIYGLYVLVVNYWVSVCIRRPAFFEDFCLFYVMGQRVLNDPEALYTSIGNIGTWVVSSHERIFHMYSPMAALLFAPFSLLPIHLAFITTGVLTLIFCALSVLLFTTCLEADVIHNHRPFVALSVLVGLALAPTFLDAYFGNVNSFLLLTCVLYIWLIVRNHPILAGIILAVGFWLKLYPIILILLLLGRRDWWQCLLSFGLTILVSFLISLFLIPYELYQTFYTHILPAYSQQTTIHIYNQSIPAVLTRMSLGVKSYLSWDNVITLPWIRFATYSFGGTLCFVASIPVFHKHYMSIPTAGSILMALIPLITPVGWGYTYMLSIPAIITCLYYGTQYSRSIRILVALFCIAFMVPSYWCPNVLLSNSLSRTLLLNRYCIVSICIILMLFIIMANNRLQGTRHKVPGPLTRDVLLRNTMINEMRYLDDDR